MVSAYKGKAYFPSSQLKHALSSFPLPAGFRRSSSPLFLPRQAQLTCPGQHKSHFPAARRPLASCPSATLQLTPNLLQRCPLTGHLAPCHHRQETPAPPPAGPCAPASSSLLPSYSHFSLGVQSNTFLLGPAAALPHKAPASGTATRARIPAPPLHPQGTQEPPDPGLCISSSFTQVTGLPKP